ncbi:MAG: hypothetical protein ACR2KX_00180 [Chitinophagaceae bacterium]
MKKKLPLILLLILGTAKSFGTANDIYHERTSNSIGGSCGIYVSNLAPASGNTVDIRFKIAIQGFTNQARIYYTIDGTNPSGLFGAPSGTTLVLTANYSCTFSEASGVSDVVNGTVPAYPTGTVIKYIVSAWHSGGGLEIFGNGGTATSAGAATVFTYTVAAPTPLTLINFSGKKVKDNVELSWITEQEINVDHFEIFHSTNGNQFQIKGSVTAKGSTSLQTQYFFTDINPVIGNNFYKLKIIDKDGKFYHSKVMKINSDIIKAVSIKTIGNDVHIQLASIQKENYSVLLINNLGQTLKTYDVHDDGISANHIIKLPANLYTNIYHIAVKGNTGVYCQSVFIK